MPRAKTSRDNHFPITISCFGHPAIVYHMPVSLLIENNLVNFTNHGVLKFAQRYLNVEFMGKTYAIGPLERQGYKVGSKSLVGLKPVKRRSMGVGTGNLSMGSIVIGGGAVNNARILSRLLPKANINLILGSGPGITEKVIRKIVTNAGDIRLCPSWSVTPLYVEVDLFPYVPDRVVLKPELAVASHTCAPYTPSSDLIIINTIYDPILLFHAMQILGASTPGVVALTIPLLSGHKFSDNEKQYYRKIYQEPCPYETVGQLSMDVSFTKANIIVVNRAEAEHLCIEMQDSREYTIQTLVCCLNRVRSKYPSSPRICLTIGEYGCLMMDSNDTLHYCYAHPQQLSDGEKHTYALGDAFTTGVSIVKAVEILTRKVFSGDTVVSVGVAVATAALLYGYDALEWSKADEIIRSGCIKYVSFKSMKELAYVNIFSHPLDGLRWERLLGIPSVSVKHELLSAFIGDIAKETQ